MDQTTEAHALAAQLSYWQAVRVACSRAHEGGCFAVVLAGEDVDVFGDRIPRWCYVAAADILRPAPLQFLGDTVLLTVGGA